MYSALSDIKAHLVVDSDFTADDALILEYVTAAEVALEAHIQANFALLAQNNGGKLPEPILQAVRLLVAGWYNNREPFTHSSVNKVPHTLDYLISLYRVY